jgi:hypothetical protein
MYSSKQRDPLVPIFDVTLSGKHQNIENLMSAKILHPMQQRQQ